MLTVIFPLALARAVAGRCFLDGLITQENPAAFAVRRKARPISAVGKYQRPRHGIGQIIHSAARVIDGIDAPATSRGAAFKLAKLTYQA